MRVNKKWALGVTALLVAGAGAAMWWDDREETARSIVDGDTVVCLMQNLSPAEKREIASLSNRPDYQPFYAAYSKVFPRCVLRGDQWERKDRLTFAALQVLLSTDKEFGRMKDASAGPVQVSRSE
jgi:hypothetical protein